MGDFPWFRDPPRRTKITDFLSLHNDFRPPKNEVKQHEDVQQHQQHRHQQPYIQQQPQHQQQPSPSTPPNDVVPLLTSTLLVASPELIASFNACIEVKERQNNQSRTVKNCFIGKEAVTAMIKANIAKDKDQAIEIGNLLMSHDVFRHAGHAAKPDQFKDDYVFYRLTPKAAAKKGRLRSLQTGPGKLDSSDPLSLSLRKGLHPVPVSYKSPSIQDNVKKIKNFCNAANNPTTSLCLQGADLTTAQAVSIAECMRSQKLLSLVFSSICFGNVGDADASGGLVAFEKLLTSLGGLSLHALVLQDIRFQVLVPSLPISATKQITSLSAQLNLRSLSLNKCQLDELAGKLIGSLLSTNTTLTHLDLSYNILGPKGVENLVGSLGSNSTLLSLNLANNGAAKGGADALSRALVANSGLLLLDLQTNDLGDEGCSLLVQGLGRNNTLTAIDLRSNGITDTGAMIFQAVFSTNFCLVEVSIFGHLTYSPKSVPSEAFTERNKRLKVLTRPTPRGATTAEEAETDEDWDEDDDDIPDEAFTIKNLDLEPVNQETDWGVSRTRARGVLYPQTLPDKQVEPSPRFSASSRARLPTQSGYVYGRVLQNAGWGADGPSLFGPTEVGRARTVAVGGDNSTSTFNVNKFQGKTSDQLIVIIQQQYEQIEQLMTQIASLKMRNEELLAQMAKEKDNNHTMPKPRPPPPLPGRTPSKPTAA